MPGENLQPAEPAAERTSENPWAAELRQNLFGGGGVFSSGR